MFDPNKIKKDFPILEVIHPETQRPIVYLDSAATSQKPQVVIEAIGDYYRQTNANVHRGVHLLSEQSTEVYESSRSIVASFFGVKPSELILTRNTTEAINGVVYGVEQASRSESGRSGLTQSGREGNKSGMSNLTNSWKLCSDDRVWVSQLEHHSNFVPWQQLCLRTGAKFEVVPIDKSGMVDLEWMRKNIDSKVKVVAVSWVSNVLGSVQNIDQIADIVHRVGALLVVDAAQAAPHLPINFDQSKMDILAFSGHKMLGPMGIGGLLVKQELLASGVVRPWLFGGGMIEEVTNEVASFNHDLAERFTAGTPDVASVVGLAAACRYLDKLGMNEVERADRELVRYAMGRLSEIKGVKLIGPRLKTDDSDGMLKQVHHDGQSALVQHDNNLSRVGSVAFLYEDVHAHDVAQVLESQRVAVRSGHHCAMPLHSHFGWSATVRASFQVYSTKEDVDELIEGLAKVKKVFS